MTLLRHLFAILLLPFMVVVIIPRWILRAWSPWDTRWIGGTLPAAFAHVAGILLFLCGFALFAWCVSLFARIGRGTLAPWAPPRSLVASGPYRLSRNPMYIAVILVLLGWAALFRSRTLLVYALAVAIAFHLRVLVSEEPWARRTFGADWEDYRARVPRWLLRLRKS